jgi:hypothetical protein
VIQEREQLFLFRKLTDISKQNTIFVKDVDAPTDCIGSRNKSGWGTDLEITMHSKSSVVSDKPGGYAQTDCIKNRWATNLIIIIITTTTTTVGSEINLAHMQGDCSVPSIFCYAVPHNNRYTLGLENISFHFVAQNVFFLRLFLSFLICFFSFPLSYALFHTFISEYGYSITMFLQRLYAIKPATGS